MMLTAQQKLRERISENMWRFQHEGSHVVRWLTGGTRPSAYVTFEQQDDKIVARCPTCHAPLGRFDASYGPATYRQIGAIREVAIEHRCSPAGQ